MIGQVIAIGDELTSGQRLDTNSQWISQRLGELGVAVLYHATAADAIEACELVFRDAIDRADVVVASGGLGPTADDLTREAIAAAAGVELARDEAALEQIRALFARRGRPMPERNAVQADFPAGSRPIPNPHGTAPGIAMLIDRPGRGPCRLFALPGVPAELFEMWENSVAPAIAGLDAARQVIRHRRLKCFGVGESALERMLPDLIRRGRFPLVGITVHEATITLRVTAAGPTPKACHEAMEPTLATIRRCLGDLVFGEEDDELEHAVTRLLSKRNETLATIEWGTDGLMAGWLAALPERSETLVGGLVVPSDKALTRMFDVPTEFIAEHGPTSAAVAERMAERTRDRLGADYALAVSEMPAGDTDATNAPFHIALASATGVESRQLRAGGHPAILRPRAAKQALNWLRLSLSE
jgi:nicotinamide-nucleotide amidase